MASKATVDTVMLEADEESAKMLRELGSDVSVSPLSEISDGGKKLGADVRVKAYHAFQGREWEGPLYMTTGEGGAMSIFKYTFSADQIKAAGADPKWIGKRVWHADPQPSEIVTGRVPCRFSAVHLSDPEKAALEADGFRAFCQNKTMFLTEAAEDAHAKKRHPKWYDFMEKKHTKAAADKTASSQEVLTTALLEMLKERQGK